MLVRRRGSGTYVRRRPEAEVDLFSLAGTTSAFQRRGITVETRVLQAMQRVRVPAAAENPFADGEAYYYSRLSLVDRMPVLIEDLYLHPELFAGIDAVPLQGRSVAEVVAEQFFMRPTGGKQNFRIAYLKDRRARTLGVSPTVPVLAVQRFLNFEQAENAVFAELHCRTDQFVFSQTIGGLADG